MHYETKVIGYLTKKGERYIALYRKKRPWQTRWRLITPLLFTEFEEAELLADNYETIRNSIV